MSHYVLCWFLPPGLMAEIESDTKAYDEALYPRPASESDEDSEQSMADSEQSMVDSTEDHTSVNMEEESDNEKAILDDFTCIICAQALVDPMTLHCGHSFCQLCLAGVWASRHRAHPLYLQCPVCRQSWKNFPAINIQLRWDWKLKIPHWFCEHNGGGAQWGWGTGVKVNQ